MSHISTQKAADLAGISKRHLQRLLNAGGVVPSATRTSGGHWRIENDSSFQNWAKSYKRWDGKSRNAKDTGIALGRWTDTKKRAKASGGRHATKLKDSATEEEWCRAILADLDEAVRNAEIAIHELGERKKYASSALIAAKQSRGNKFSQWVRKNIPSIRLEDVKWLTYEPRATEDRYIETIKGLVLDAKTNTRGRKQRRRTTNPLGWIKWSAKIRKQFDEIDVGTLDAVDAQSALTHLKPLKAIIETLESRS